MSGEHYGAVDDGRQHLCYYPSSTHGDARLGSGASPIAWPGPKTDRHASRRTSHSRHAQLDTYGDRDARLSCRQPLDGSCSRSNSSLRYWPCNAV